MIAELEKKIRQLLCGEIEVVQKGLERYAIHTPFSFGDGDSFVSVLKKEGDSWVMSDEGHTFMHMSYEDVDFLAGMRGRLLNDALAEHGLDNRNGVLSLRIPSDELIGHAVFSFVQALSKVSNVTRLTRDVVRSAFMEDLREFIESIVPESQREFNWTDPENDPQELYPVDCRIITPQRAWMVFGVTNDEKCKNVTITCNRLEDYYPNSRSLAIFENQAEINTRDVARLTDVIFKQFSSLMERQRIKKYFHEMVMSV